MEKSESLIMKFKPSIITLLLVSILPMLAACSSSFDMQGQDPQEYYAAHPIENKVETRHAFIAVNFDGKTQKLLEESNNSFFSGLKDINPHAVDGIVLQASYGVTNKSNQVQYVQKMLRKNGFFQQVKLVNDSGISANEIIVDITYAAVILPDCPDWRKSPVTTYSNTVPANYGCASTYNLGLMIDNPNDLVRGQDSRKNNAERSSKVLSDYRTGAGASAAGASAAPASR